MRRWFVLALAPTGVLAANALVALSGGLPAGPSLIFVDVGRLLSLVLLAVEVIGLAWLGGSLVQRWPAAPHERWTLPMGVAVGFLPWVLLLDADGATATMAALAGWVVGSIALGAIVPMVSSRRAARATALAGGVVLLLLIPFLVLRAQHGAALVPWWSAPLWAPSAILGVAFGQVGFQLMLEAWLVTMMVLFGSAVYLATVLTRAPSTVERMTW